MAEVCLRWNNPWRGAGKLFMELHQGWDLGHHQRSLSPSQRPGAGGCGGRAFCWTRLPRMILRGVFAQAPDSGSQWEELVQLLSGRFSIFPGVCTGICADSAPVPASTGLAQMCGCVAPARELLAGGTGCGTGDPSTRPVTF